MSTNHAPVENLDQCLDEFLGGENSLQLTSEADAWRPRVDVHKLADAYRLEIELPGWSLDQVQIEIVDNCLEIHCQREVSSSEQDVIRRERHVGKYFRCFKLPEDAMPEKVKSEAENGIVSIRLPREN